MSAKKVYDLKKTANNFSEVKIVKEPVLPASINIRQ